jgi:dihydrofolate reductase
MITIMVSCDKSGAIGYRGRIPWHAIPEDMARFRKETLHHWVVMGRKTADVRGRPLDERTNIVLTRNPDWRRNGFVATYYDLIPLLKDVQFHEIDLYIVGGAELYEQALPYAHRILMTVVPDTYVADRYWKPDLKRRWVQKSEEHAIHDGEIVCTFYEYFRTLPDKFA